MKNFALGFLLSGCICLISYIVWENHRHVPVIIQQVPVPVAVPLQQSLPFPPNPNLALVLEKDNDNI